MSTTKYEGPIVVGMKMVKVAHHGDCDLDEIGKVFEIREHSVEIFDSNDFRHAYRPVDAPAEKRERALAGDWESRPLGWEWYCDGPCRRQQRCGTVAYVGAKYYMCEPCAEAAGAFAPPAPAKTGCGDCGVEWCGQIMERMHPSGNSYSVVDTESPGPRYGSGACLRRALANGTPRAKPAEPKPAPAEKAKREWRAPREMAKGFFDCVAAESTFRGMVSRDRCDMAGEPYSGPGARKSLLAALAREKPPTRVFPETRYNATTDAHGKLSRLVESGLRADVRQDETRFEAGLRRGAK